MAVSSVIALVAVVSAFSALRSPLPSWLRLTLALGLAGWILVSFGFRIGRDAGSALLVAMLALKLSELRHTRDARSMVGFAFFAPFSAFLQDQGPLTLLLSIPASALGLAALNRVADHDAPTDSQIAFRMPLRAAGFSLLMALPLAIVGFFLFPRLGEPIWGLPDNAMGRTGISEKMSPGDWLDLFADDSAAFRVDFESAVPPREKMYWRGPVLTAFDGRTWTRSLWQESIELQPVSIDRATNDPQYRYQSTLEASERRYVFALDIPTEVPASTKITGDMSVLADIPIRDLNRFLFESTKLKPYQQKLPALMRSAALALPAGFNAKTLARARAWRADSSTPKAYIDRVLAWYNAEFSYSLAAPPLGRDTADEFLFDTKIGFCEHFASSFTILMRAAGIPARVVTGYAGGNRNSIGNYWMIRQSDAHAWSEVWLENIGWIRIDPTAAVAPERVFETVEDLPGISGINSLRGASDIGDWLRNQWNDVVLGFNATRQSMLLRPFGIEQADARQLGVAFTVLLGIAIALTLWLLWRPAPQAADTLERAWRQFVRRLHRAGVKKRDDEPALSFGERAAKERPHEAQDLITLSRGYVRQRYAVNTASARQFTEERLALIQSLRRYRPKSK